MKETTIQVRCSVGEKERWQKLAEARGASLSTYVRMLLNSMADKEKSNG